MSLFSSSSDDGGLDPTLGFSDADGNQIQQQDDGLVAGYQVSNGISPGLTEILLSNAKCRINRELNLVYMEGMPKSCSHNYEIWDTYFTQYLEAGNYTPSVAQYAAEAVSSYLADGLQYDGAGNENFPAKYGCNNGSFCGASGDKQTNDWMFDIEDVDSATVTHEPSEDVPEPIAGLVLAAGMGGAALRRAKKSKKKLDH